MRSAPGRSARLHLLGAAFVALAVSTACTPAETPPTTTAAAVPAAAPAAPTGPTRMERDLLGEKAVPSDAYYGVQTARALENFQISGIPINHYPGFIEAWAIVKLAAARANTDVGAMKPETLAAIEKAVEAVRAGKYHDQFKVDWYQGGAGTSTNMNANEVLANVALELMGRPKGDYHTIEPHDHLNLSQSTNDSYPTAIKVALILRNDKLIAELQTLVASFRAKGAAFIDIVKMGRTELQDAVPMTVGQEFHAFAASLESEITVLRDAEKYLYVQNMGATAIGTGLNAPKGYAEKTAQHLAKITGKPIVMASDMLAATWDQQGFVAYSSALKSVAIKLSKIASDLILLASGPRAGLAEINLPAVQPGSSIMPGKVNPVIPELVNLVMFRIMGNDVTVTLAAHSGQLQLNAYEPVEGLAMMESQHLLFTTSQTFRTKCVDGITVNEKVLARNLEETVGIVTALNPVLGYDKATELANEAYKSGKGILEVIREQKLLTEEQIKDILDPAKLTGLDKSKYPNEEVTVHRNFEREKEERIMRKTRTNAVAMAMVALAVSAQLAHAQTRKPNITILATGGTIAGAAATGTQSGYTSGAVTIDAMIKAVPGLSDLATIKGEQVANVGSQDMSFQILLTVAKRINELARSNDVDGFVITHGTDTLEESAFFLNLTVKTDKPVVMVGSMRPSTAVSADGPLNIYNAVGVAIDPAARGRGVLVVMNDSIHAAHSLTKTSTTSVETFQSPVRGLAGVASYGKNDFYLSPTWKHTTQTEFDIASVTQLPRVDIVMAYVDMPADVIDNAVARGAKGIVIAGVGNGNMTKAAVDAAAAAVKKGVVVVRSSRVPTGLVGRNVEVDDDKLGFIASDELNPQKARILLSLALLKTPTPAQLQTIFRTY